MTRALKLGVLTLAGMIALGSAYATADDKKEKLDTREMTVLRDRAQDDVNMWKVAEYASQHAATDRVRNLGKAIIEERRTDLRDIQKIAKDHDENLNVPETMSPQQKIRYDELTRQPGENFDRSYVKDVVANYERAIPQLKRTKDSAPHVDVREWAQKNLTMFEDHLKEARDAEHEVWKLNDKDRK
jgi:predicted outer membrane protein